MGAMVNPTARGLLGFVAMEFSWPIMLFGVGGLVAMSLLLVWGVRVLAGHERDEETASGLGVEIATALAREPGLRTAQILPVASIPIEARPSLELTGQVPSAAARELALEIARRELDRLRPGMMVIDRLEVAPSVSARRSA
jgi:hypothetical protein